MSAGGAELTLIVPGLAGPADPGTGDPDEASRVLVADLPLPGIGRLVARAGALCSPHRAADATGLLFELLAVERPQGGDWPVAAVSRLATCADAAAGVWMRADPVHLRPDPTRLVLLEPAALGMGLEEARAIAAWLNAHEHAPGPALEVLRADAWYLRLDAAPRIRTTPPAAAHGDDADPHLPAGPDARGWHARMNEFQMLLHACPINAERERAGRPAVNSVWFWGAGALPAPPPAPFDVLHGDGDLERGAARWCAMAAEPLPEAAEPWLSSHPRGRRLLLLPGLHLPARDADTGAWRAAVADLDARWLAPLAGALARGRVGRLAIHAGSGAGLAISRREARRWWRRTLAPGQALARLRRAAAGAGPGER